MSEELVNQIFYRALYKDYTDHIERIKKKYCA